MHSALVSSPIQTPVAPDACEFVCERRAAVGPADTAEILFAWPGRDSSTCFCSTPSWLLMLWHYTTAAIVGQEAFAK